MVSDEEIIEINRKLEEHESRIRGLEIFLRTEKEKRIEEPKKISKSVLKKFSGDVGVDEGQLKCVFDFEKDDLNLKITVEGKNESEKQFKITLCFLTAYHYCYGKDEIKSQNLRKKLEWLGINSLGNLSNNLKTYKRFIIPKGKSGSPEFAYKITFPGIKKGLELIKKLSGA